METVFNFDSYPDATGRFTRFRIDKKGCTLVQIKSLSANEANTTFTTTFARRSLFQIDFRPLHLASPSHGNLPAYNGPLRSFEAANTDPPFMEEIDMEDNRGTERFTKLTYQAKQTGNPNISIVVTVTFRALNLPGEQGWIHMEISHTYPSGTRRGGKQAWESSVIFPRVSYKKEAVDEFSIIDPSGFTQDLHTVARGTFDSAEGKRLHGESFLNIQFLAWFKHYTWMTENEPRQKRFAGIVMHGTDEQGYHKTAGYFPKGKLSGELYPGGINETDIYLRLTAPIFLKERDQNPLRYARADQFLIEPPRANENGARKQGFGGAVMDYRVKAVVLVADDNRDALDWHQFADEYKAWLEYKKPVFWKRAAQQGENGPLNQMGPVTVISNYSILGAVQNTPPPGSDLADYQKIYDAQAIYPVASTDGQIDLPTRLKSIKDWFNYDEKGGPLALEAQLWGWEKGSYYCLTDDLEPAWDAAHNDGSRPFKRMVEGMFSDGIWSSITTDPTFPRFGGVRFHGHFRPGQEEIVQEGMYKPEWDDRFWWKYRLPSEFASNEVALEDEAYSTRIYVTDIRRPNDGPSRARRQRIELEPLRDVTDPQKKVAGVPQPFFGFIRHHLCPIQRLHEIYHQDWLENGLKNYVGNQLLEFMFHNYSGQTCYRTDHNHLNETIPNLYTGVLGYGPWYADQMRILLEKAVKLYQHQDSFALTNEFTPTEYLMDLFHEHYDHFDIPPFTNSATVDYASRPLQQQDNPDWFNRPTQIPFAAYLLSGKLTTRMTMARQTPHGHPGYKLIFRAVRPERGAWKLNPARIEMDIAAATYRNFTLEAWVNPASGQALMNLFTLADGSSAVFTVNLGRVGAEFNVRVNLRNKRIVFERKLPADAWSHVAVVGTRKENSIRCTLYINGIFYSTKSFRDDPAAPIASKLSLGGNVGDSPGNYVGMLDEVRLWRYARSHREIHATLYRLIEPAETPAPHKHLTMDITPQEAEDTNLCRIEGNVEYVRTHFDTDNHEPRFMLRPDRDIPGGIPDFWTWKYVCEAFANHYYQVMDTGVSPQGLTTNSGVVYSHNRAVEDLFNLRFHIFRICRMAVLGRRIFVGAYLFEEPVTINQPLLKVARAAVQLQTSLREVFLKGRMLGETLIVQGNRRIETWYAPWRSFHDVPKLATDCVFKLRGKLQEIGYGPQEMDFQGIEIRDVISVGTDRPDPPGARPTRVVQDQVNHFVWQGPAGDSAIYYVFSNAGNTTLDIIENGPDNRVEFHTHRGMVAGQAYAYSTTHFDSAAAGPPTDDDREEGTVICPNTVRVRLAPRSFKVVKFALMP